ncbi:sensor histidine kinase [Spirosoma endbachense]|uniref:Histidine kinase n=1 Tax=Spirosoma endbachense TaxID=2666025 RepID=A0A6P1VNF5_9BACT|nr:sensor histidine kinase [Spirosoma endbachense]QHV94235.1 histidine kinase [Spirosoma endbachense]
MSELLSDNTKNDQAIPFRFTRLYVTLFIILAVLLTGGQILTQWRLSTVQDELWIIRYTALQRHQSQQIVKQALQVTDINERDNFNQNLSELSHVFSTFERYHLQSREGQVIAHNVLIPNSNTVQRLYDSIRPEFSAFQRSIGHLIRLKRPEDVTSPDTQASLKLLLANEKPFLEEIDTIVRQHTSELRNQLTRLESIELYLYLVSIMVLLGIGLLIFRPATRRLKQTIAQLIEAERQASIANKQLLSVNKSLSETRQKLFEATRLQYQQEIDEQKLRTSYLMAGQEDERKRLSRDLHDGLGQMLTAIKLQIEGLEAGLKRSLAGSETTEFMVRSKSISNLKKLVTQTIQETRTISNNLMPSVLSDFGIIPAIKMLAENDRSDTVDVTFESNLTTDDPRLDKNVEIMLYRITQEALSNAVRHAHPSQIHIELIERQNYVHLIVTDNGRGFRPASQRSKLSQPAKNDRAPSQGLHNMQERAKLLNGKLKISSVPGKGTKVQVSIPYKMQSAHYDIN